MQHAGCRTTPAPRVALDVCQRFPARRLLGAVRWTCAALWPPTAAALYRAAFAGGLVPFHAFERSRAIFAPSCSLASVFRPTSSTDAGPLRGVGLARVSASPRTMSAALLLVVTVLVSGAEAHGSGGALIEGVFRAALGLGGTLRRGTPPPRGRVGAEVPAVPSARGCPAPGGRGSGARGTGCPMIIPCARFAHRQRSPLERLMVEAAYGLLGVGPFT